MERNSIILHVDKIELSGCVVPLQHRHIPLVAHGDCGCGSAGEGGGINKQKGMNVMRILKKGQLLTNE